MERCVQPEGLATAILQYNHNLGEVCNLKVSPPYKVAEYLKLGYTLMGCFVPGTLGRTYTVLEDDS